MCADNRVVKSLALVLAAMDTWFDGLRISLVLGLIHIVLVRWMC